MLETRTLLPPTSGQCSSWPQLFNFPFPPERLHVQGRPEAFSLLDDLPDAGLAVVGTRNPQARSRALVRDWIKALPRDEPRLIVVSGMARGIDAEAHETALEAGIPTIAVLGTPLEALYPEENAALKARILSSGGLLISEMDPETEIKPSTFLRRNRLIAAWSRAVWIVEASYRSGALNTARWAREYDRVSYATPCFPGDPALAGNQKLLDREEALPLWGVPCLGAAWPEIPSRVALHPRARRSGATQSSLSLAVNVPLSDPEKITERVREATAQNGGIAVHELLDYCMESGWPPQRFFEALQAALGAARVVDERGILIARGLA